MTQAQRENLCIFYSNVRFGVDLERRGQGQHDFCFPVEDVARMSGYGSIIFRLGTEECNRPLTGREQTQLDKARGDAEKLAQKQGCELTFPGLVPHLEFPCGYGCLIGTV